MEPAENHKPTILIIDDEEQIRSLLVDLLSDTYKCSDAGSAEEALARAEAAAAEARARADELARQLKERGQSAVDAVRKPASKQTDTETAI